MTMRIFLLLATLIVIVLLPQFLAPFHIRVVQLFFFTAALALAWNVMGGLAGYWSFGHTVFIGMGAFAAAHFVAKLGLPAGPLQMIAGIVFGALFCGIVAAIIAYPILRLRGIYFAIAMLGIGQVAAELANNVGWFQGDVGLFLETALPDRVFTGMVSLIVMRSRFGYGLLAIREDEDTAKMLGVPTEQIKAFGFTISAVLVGMLGATYAYSLGYFTASSVFRIDFSLNMIIYCLIGGIGTLAGPVVGAALMLLLTQIILGQLLELHLMATGLVVILIVLTLPNGVMGLVGGEAVRRHFSMRAGGKAR